jgi:superfamily II DNA/RNA helicase
MKALDIKSISSLLKEDVLNSNEILSILKTLCLMVSRAQEQYDPKTQELVLRTLDRRDLFQEYPEILNSLVRQVGLYPYLDLESISEKDALALEMHRPENFYHTDNEDSAPEKKVQRGYIFHKVQAEVFGRILDGESVILSAPTSFGKSAIIDALIESGKFQNIVIVVPTIALIDETRRRLSRYRDTHKVITHASQALSAQNIFIFTQERVVDYPELPPLDIFVIDEFYKLNPTADKERAATLNHAFYKLSKKAKQFYLLGPNIQAIPPGFPERFRCLFYRTDYSTVVTELTRITPVKGNELVELVALCRRLIGPTLIFCASPAKARKIANALLDGEVGKASHGMAEAADWVATNYDPEWTLSRALRMGIGMHHGRMPRALAQVVVKGFNSEAIDFLVCTSTLIEGVNTKAKNVIIFDNKIATQKYDYFTFNNIRGRSGRMFEHFVGNVYLFHPEPQEDLPFVDIPVFTQDINNTPESLLIQLDTNDLEGKSRERMEPYRAQSILSLETLRSNVGIDPQEQLNLAVNMTRHKESVEALSWTGLPTYEQLESLCIAIWDYFVLGGKIGGVTSGRQLAFKVNQLRSHTLRQLIQAEIANSATPDDAVEDVLDFVRQWPQYRFGRLAMAINRIQNEIAPQLGIKPADYTYFVGQVENLFSDPALSALDEYGIPFPLAKRLERYLSTGGDLDAALDRLRNLDTSNLKLTDFEKALIADAKEYS